MRPKIRCNGWERKYFGLHGKSTHLLAHSARWIVCKNLMARWRQLLGIYYMHIRLVLGSINWQAAFLFPSTFYMSLFCPIHVFFLAQRPNRSHQAATVILAGRATTSHWNQNPSRCSSFLHSPARHNPAVVSAGQVDHFHADSFLTINL
jgi:hypothetical protein